MFAHVFQRPKIKQTQRSGCPEDNAIIYRLPTASRVVLRIYDSSGKEIQELMNKPQGPGEHEVLWDGRTEKGRKAPSGIYYYRLFTGNSAFTGRIVHSNSH